ncbi:hypothetical protein QOZ80_5AG0384400 [Eleusine coracana subsp. coracana]|nr:hypothetical protein QOZ80_5AG0384400 [Eleusine coracana subsp. coracana]
MEIKVVAEPENNGLGAFTRETSTGSVGVFPFGSGRSFAPEHSFPLAHPSLHTGMSGHHPDQGVLPSALTRSGAAFPFFGSMKSFARQHHQPASQENGGSAAFMRDTSLRPVEQGIIMRSFVNMYRDLGYYWLRFAIYIALCLTVGTIFYDVGDSFGSIQARGSLLNFVAAFLTFMAIGGFPSFIEDMKIFGRERLNGHYGVSSFVIANTVSSTPYLALISLIPGAIAYYLVGLQSSFGHFAYFALVLFVTMMVVEGLMMIVASVVPDFLMGIITGAGIQGVMMLNGGFFRLPNDLPKPVWRYPMYYVAFHKYANQGFYKNEFLGLTFPNNQATGCATISGGEILRNIWQVEMGYSKWVDLAVLCGMVILYRMLFLAIEKLKPMIAGLRFRNTMRSVQVAEQQGSGSP